MSNRTEELTILLSQKEKDFIIKSATDKCLSIEDFIMLSALSVDASQNVKQGFPKNIIHINLNN